MRLTSGLCATLVALLLVSVGVLSGTGAAFAGDRAQVAVIGFSPDGASVAFEEYGSQDGSGFPYANIYVLDVAANDWVAGSPVRVMITDEQMSEDELFTVGVAAARAQAMEQAAPVIAARGIVPGNVGQTVIHHPFGDVDAPAYEVRFSIAAGLNTYFSEHNTLRLTLSPTRSETCVGYGIDEVFIFTLTVGPDHAPTVLQQDRQLPRSRVCPTDYRITHLVAYGLDHADQSQCCAERYALLVLLAMEMSPGFEGPDTRYLGVSGIVPLQP
ncbi:MAG: DUF2259 domain-containing protein [Alphaproteobacteria bacterium]